MLVLQVIYLTAPAIVAGLVHSLVIARDWLPSLARPIDGGAGILGPNKTWRGVAVMVGGATGVGLVQHAVALGGTLVDYNNFSTLVLGPALGMGYSLGELPNSFVKRRLGIAPGSRARGAALQYVADQGDSVAGATLALTPFEREPGVLAIVVVTGFALHALVDRLLYALHVKEAVG